MSKTEAQARASKKYYEKNKDTIKQYNQEYESKFYSYRMRMTLEQKELLDEKVKESGKSINQYILDKVFND